jgi:hypothetical protein
VVNEPPLIAANDNFDPEIERRVQLWRQIIAVGIDGLKTGSQKTATVPAQE